MVMPCRCRASSSMRTVLKAVVRAPMAPTVSRRIALHHAAEAVEVVDVLARRPAERGATLCGCRAVNVNAVLAEHVHDRELAAERVAAQLAGPSCPSSSG